MEEIVILMANVHALNVIQGKNVIPALMDLSKVGLNVYVSKSGYSNYSITG